MTIEFPALNAARKVSLAILVIPLLWDCTLYGEPEVMGQKPCRFWFPVESGEETNVDEETFEAYVIEKENRGLQAKLKLALKYENEGASLKALSVYQSVVQNNPESRIAFNGHLFWPARDFALERISRLGDQPLKAYRDIYDSIASKTLSLAIKASDMDMLKSVGRDYLLSSSGPRAIQRVADLMLSRGELAQAVGQWQQLARFRGGLPFPDPTTPLKLALCYKTLGYEPEFQQLLQSLEPHLEEKYVIAGKQTRVADFIFQLKDIGENTTGDWADFGGDKRHSRLFTSQIEIGKLLWSSSWLGPAFRREGNGEQEQDVQTGSSHLVPGGPILPQIFPVISDNNIYYRVTNGVIARKVGSGEIVWRHSLVGQPLQGDQPWATSPQMLAVSEDYVYVCFGPEIRGRFQLPETILRCIRKSDGKAMWDALASKGVIENIFEEDAWNAGDAADAESFIGAPIVEDGRLYVGVVTRSRETECSLACLDAQTGKQLWKTFISLSVMPRGNRTFTPLPVGGLPALADGLVFYSTNLGAVIAADKETGVLKWIRRYKQKPDSRSMFPLDPDEGLNSWQINAPLVSGGKLFVTPQDSDFLHCLDARTGRLFFSANRGQNAYLIGCQEGRIYLSGNQISYLDAENGNLLNRTVTLEGTPAGLGLIDTKFVHCPGSRHIHRSNLGNGKLGHARAWEQGMSPGNLIHLGKLFVVAGTGGLQVYSSEGYFEQQVERAKANPQDALAHIEVGYLMLSRDRLDEAIQYLARAVELSRMSKIQNGRQVFDESRDLLFQALTRRADLAAKGSDWPAAESAYAQALQTAPTEKHTFNAVLNLSRYAESRGQWKAAIHYLQQIGNHSHRRMIETDGISVSPALYTRHKIADIIRRNGPEPYEEFEAAAARLLEQALHQDWAVRCNEIVQRYPNSQAAVQAKVVLGTTWLKQGQPFKSFPFWNELFLRSERKNLRAGVYLAITLALLQEKESARRVIAELKQAHGSNLYKFLEQETEFEALGNQLFAALAEPEPTRKRLAIPLKEKWSCDVETISSLILSQSFENECLPVWHQERLTFVGRGGLDNLSTDTGKMVWDKEMRTRTKGWLGISYGFGRVINSIIDTPARRAGLKPGDIILKVNGERIDASTALQAAIADAPRDRPIQIEVQRELPAPEGPAEQDPFRRSKSEILNVSVRLKSPPQNIRLAGVSGDTIVCGTKGELFGVDAITGAQVWTQAFDEFAMPGVFLEQKLSLAPIGIDPPGEAEVRSGPESSHLGLIGLNILGRKLLMLRAADGMILWEMPLDHFHGNPILTPDALFVFQRHPESGETSVTALNPFRGVVMHRMELGVKTDPDSAFRLLDNGNFAALSQSSFQCREVATGELLWQHEFEGKWKNQNFTEAKIFLSGRIILVGTGSLLLALDIATGKTLWNVQLPESHKWLKRSVIGKQAFYAISASGEMHALELYTGKEFWADNAKRLALDVEYPTSIQDNLLFIPRHAHDKPSSTTLEIRDLKTGKIGQELTIPGEFRYSRIVGSTYVIVSGAGAFGFDGTGE
ncbi:MAG: PQQ-binding-like beta-propeller repeat protein [Planctomycetota bacterium]|nr:PQQ-binding-like beta-propeller repeat protein [Planctomycetota bacterium]